MNNYLFFRTDRIGDFLVSAILIKSIKRNDKNSHITVVASNKNYFYIKTLDFVDEVFLYPKSFIKRIFFFFNLRLKKYKLICALDGKKRSIYFSILLKSKIKILMTTKSFFKKTLKNFFSKIYLFSESKDKLDEIYDVLNLCKMSFSERDIHFLSQHKIISQNVRLINNFIIFHFDEKWIFDQYIKKYQSIQPNVKEFEDFINGLIQKTNSNLIITTGTKKNIVIEKIFLNFKKVNENLYEKKINDKIVHVYIDINFFDLKFLIKNTKYLITCHGAATHLASALNIKIYDIFDISQKDFYQKWYKHIKDYEFFYRENFKVLTNKILNKL